MNIHLYTRCLYKRILTLTLEIKFLIFFRVTWEKSDPIVPQDVPQDVPEQPDEKSEPMDAKKLKMNENDESENCKSSKAVADKLVILEKQCPHCNLTFSNCIIDLFNHHVSKCREINDKKKSAWKKYPCLYCNEKFDLHYAIENHNKQCPKKPQKCPHCKVEFFFKDFENHVSKCVAKEFAKERNNQCTFCKAKFVMKPDFNEADFANHVSQCGTKIR